MTRDMMRRSRLFVCCSVLLAAAAVTAQERRQGGPQPYNFDNEITMTGSVVSLDTVTPPDGAAEQAVLMINAEGGALGVFMGPSAWLAKQGVSFPKNAEVEVTGMRGARFNGNPALLGRVVKIGTKTVTLRDAKGQPLWAGQR